MLTTHKKGSEKQLFDITSRLKEKANSYTAIHFHFSKLMEHYKSEYQTKIAVNIINDLLSDAEGEIVIASDYDIFVVCKGARINTIQKLIFQLRYLYMDDPLAYDEDGLESSKFCRVFDLKNEWPVFFAETRAKFNRLQEDEKVEKIKLDYPQLLTPEKLTDVKNALGKVNIAPAVRMQPVCVSKKAEFKTMYRELYINIPALGEMLSTEIDLTSNLALFKYLTRILDTRVLELIRKNSVTYLRSPLSLNMNVETILSEEFNHFNATLETKEKKKIIFEIQLADVFANIEAFFAARDFLQSNGYRICLDGINALSFQQIDRNSLGFDLAKIHWNADLKSDVKNDVNKGLKAAIDKCGVSRVILCRCDSLNAIYYGQSLGVSIFQGRYIDSVIDPESSVVN